MIMAIDVSNTNITLGTFKGEKLLKIYRVTTKVPRTSVSMVCFCVIWFVYPMPVTMI